MNWMGGSRRQLHRRANDRNMLLKAGFERFRRKEQLRREDAAAPNEPEASFAQGNAGKHARKDERSRDHRVDAHGRDSARTVSKTSDAKARHSRKHRSKATSKVHDQNSNSGHSHGHSERKKHAREMCRSSGRHVDKATEGQRQSRQSTKLAFGEDSGNTDFVDVGLQAWSQSGQLPARDALKQKPRNAKQDAADLPPQAPNQAPARENNWASTKSQAQPGEHRKKSKRRRGAESNDKCPSAQRRRLAIEEEWRRIADTGLCGILGAARFANEEVDNKPSARRQRPDPRDTTVTRNKGSQRISAVRQAPSSTGMRTPSPTQRVSLPAMAGVRSNHGANDPRSEHEEQKQMHKDLLPKKRIKLLTEAWAWGRQQGHVDYDAQRGRDMHSASAEQAALGCDSEGAAAASPAILAICDQAAESSQRAVGARTHGLTRHDSATSEPIPSTQLDDDKSSDLLSTQPDVETESKMLPIPAKEDEALMAELTSAAPATTAQPGAAFETASPDNHWTVLELAHRACASDHQAGPMAAEELPRDRGDEEHMNSTYAEDDVTARGHEQAYLASTASFSSALRSWQASSAASTTGRLSLRERRKLCAAFLSR